MRLLARWFSLQHLHWARLWVLLGVFILLAIFYLSLTSSQLPIPKVRHIDKLLHFIAYLVLMGWFIQLYHHRYGRVIIAIVFILMGVGIEFLQSLSPVRQFDPLDMLANTAGVSVAWLAGFTGLDSILMALESGWFKLFDQRIKQRL